VRGFTTLALLLAAITGGCVGRSVDGESDEATDSGDDAELEMLCETGCERFETCAPAQMQMQYGDRQGCEMGCFEQFATPASCRAAAPAYAMCTAALTCEEWPALLADPATSACAAQWADVSPVCDFG